MPLKSGTEEITYLLKKVFEKYEKDTNDRIKTGTTRTNYDEIAVLLSAISNQLPYTAEKLGHQPYEQDRNRKKSGALEASGRYNISSGQIMEAARGNVPNPKNYLVDSCYIYVYKIGRKGFAMNPCDPNLLESGKIPPAGGEPATAPGIGSSGLARPAVGAPAIGRLVIGKGILSRAGIWPMALGLLLVVAFIGWYRTAQKWRDLRKDFSLLPYRPTVSETDSLAGIWLCYTGSPQARRSEPRRYHLVVNNIMEVRAKDGYFTFHRWGANFDHLGYMQFEEPWLVSIFSHVQNDDDSIQSPRHSLLRLNEPGPYHAVMSASWNFDVGNNNKIIGIREIYIKQGKGGHAQEIFNRQDNNSCHCKIVRWYKDDGSVQDYQIKNQLLDTINIPAIKPLLDENSILLNDPEPGLIMRDSASK